MPKTRVNLYLDEESYNRTKEACDKLGFPISEYISDFLKDNIEVLEAATSGGDSKERAALLKRDIADVLMDRIIELADSLKTIKAQDDRDA